MGAVIHILLSVLISVVIGGFAYWLHLYHFQGISIGSIKQFFLGGMTAEFYFKVIAFIGLVLGILTK